jgi:hypothetical protein
MRRGWTRAVVLILVGLVAGLSIGIVVGTQLPTDDDTSRPLIGGERIKNLRGRPRIALPEPVAGPIPAATLTVHTDGCGVIRTDVPADQHTGLTWNVYDADGFQVLGRVADNETRYRYFQAGTYTVNLEARIGTKSVTISNTVTINC